MTKIETDAAKASGDRRGRTNSEITSEREIKDVVTTAKRQRWLMFKARHQDFLAAFRTRTTEFWLTTGF
jgi:hypothetical protein